MSLYFLILPHQLFDVKYLDLKYHYVIYEHPHYFKDYNYNKKKLVLHFGSLAYYYEYLKVNGFKVSYIGFNEKFKLKKYTLFNPIDKLIMSGDYTIIDTPNLLLTNETCEEYRNKTDKFFFHSFYMFNKKKLNIIPNIKSLDKENRKKIPNNIKIPSLPNNDDDKYKRIGIIKTEKYFSNNVGNCDNFIFPLTHVSSKNWLKHFIKTKIKHFGDYEDAIVNNEPYLFHSVLSSSINIGLLNPMLVIKEIMKYKDKIPLNSLEGFIRQLFWREYQRYCYKYIDFKGFNYFGNKTKLSKKWYTGNTGILPVDDCIKKAFNNAYLHHIERLMIIGNYMNLSKIAPKEGRKWFMEFSIDSYDWVMDQNVLEMVFFVTGGKTMKRPYISSSNYILKMSNYKKDLWCDIWNEKYKKFIKEHYKKLYKFRYYFKF